MSTTSRQKTDLNWFARHRQEWIADIIRVFGFINRVHIERKFGIGTAQASHDLRIYQDENPGALIYDASSKTYRSAQ